jgi:nicotinate phosphoribosyltransferase
VHKETVGARKWAYRVLDGDGRATAEHIVTEPGPHPGARALQVPVVRGGEVVHRPSLADVRAHHLAARAELPPDAFSLEAGPPALGG